jgi:hypothetical protein
MAEVATARSGQTIDQGRQWTAVGEVAVVRRSLCSPLGQVDYSANPPKVGLAARALAAILAESKFCVVSMQRIADRLCGGEGDGVVGYLMRFELA